MAKYHCLLKYISIYHYFGNMQGSTTFWILEFGELKFFMVLKFHKLGFFEKIIFKFAGNILMELEYHKKFSKFFHGIRVHGSQVPQTRVSKKWQIPTYFRNSGRLIYISINSAIVPFQPQSSNKMMQGRHKVGVRIDLQVLIPRFVFIFIFFFFFVFYLFFLHLPLRILGSNFSIGSLCSTQNGLQTK